jgi:hypothetical protein
VIGTVNQRFANDTTNFWVRLLGSWLCENQFCGSLGRNIDSNRKPIAHEGFAEVARSILLLRAGDCFERFYTARVMSVGSAMPDPGQLTLRMQSQ